MKKIILASVIIIAFASCTPQQKSGFVNNSELINEYQGKKAIEDKFNLKYAHNLKSFGVMDG